MTKRSLLAAAILVAFSTPAFAFYCPLNVKAIDANVARTNLSAAERAEVKAFRDEGERLHNAGNHQGAVVELAKAMRILVAH